MEIYLDGLKGHQPAQPVAPEELEERARAALPPPAYVYVAGGPGAGDTIRANRDAFRRWRIAPRFLRDVSRCDLGFELLGRRLPVPVLLAPVGVQAMLHPEAELATAEKGREAYEEAVKQLVRFVTWFKDRPKDRRRDRHRQPPTMPIPWGQRPLPT